MKRSRLEADVENNALSESEPSDGIAFWLSKMVVCRWLNLKSFEPPKGKGVLNCTFDEILLIYHDVS